MIAKITHADTRAQMNDTFGALAVLGQALGIKVAGLASVGGGETQIAMTQRDQAQVRALRTFGEGVLEGADAVYLEVARAQAANGGVREVAEVKEHNQ